MTPRLGKANKLLHRFYEPLILLQILNPSTQLEGRSLLERQHVLCGFLDQLAWICDSDKAGKTVTAIAVEENPSGPTYWLASPGIARADVEEHITAVMHDLKSAYDADDARLERLAENLRSKCIAFSRRKVKNYRGALTDHVNNFDQGSAESSACKSDLFQPYHRRETYLSSFKTRP